LQKAVKAAFSGLIDELALYHRQILILFFRHNTHISKVNQ
jgi:hypothetical protein